MSLYSTSLVFSESLSRYKIIFSLSLGPKGVINDWRRFKLESLDQENLPPSKKELLRQMSSPNRAKDDSRANLNRKVESNTPRQRWQTSTSMGSKHCAFDCDLKKLIKGAGSWLKCHAYEMYLQIAQEKKRRVSWSYFRKLLMNKLTNLSNNHLN